MPEEINSFQRVEAVQTADGVSLYSTSVGTFTDHPRKKIGDYSDFESAEKARLRRCRTMLAVETGTKAVGITSVVAGTIYELHALINTFQNPDYHIEDDILKLIPIAAVTLVSLAGAILSKEQKIKAQQQIDLTQKAAEQNSSLAWTYSMDP